MKVIFCGFRSWALNIIDEIKCHKKIISYEIICSKNEYDLRIKEPMKSIDIIVFLGWSWIIPKEISDNYFCIGIHPSDLPEYRGGSPIQNQIIDGIKKTKISLMTISNKLDGGDIWLKNELDLTGNNIDSIFKNIETSSVSLLNNFFNSYPNIKPVKQNLSEGSYFRRRKPQQSRLDLEDFQNKSFEEIYNIIRCLTDPYPNAYLQDKDGNKLIFKEVHYEPAIKADNNYE